MSKKSIFILLLILATNTVFSANKLRWKDYQISSSPEDTASIVPPDYEKAVYNLMNEWIMKRATMEQCSKDSTAPIFYSDSVYISRLQKLPYRIEMPFNNIVKIMIERYARRISQVEYMIGLGEHYYFSIFEHALARYDLPLELKYLPIIESALNPRAISTAGAGGLWQFMIATGKVYNLEINSLVDDRFDPIKSSDAAARYLRDLHNIYNDWHLVIAAYNCGPGNVARAIRKSGGKIGYWDIYPYLPKETRGYVPIFIAANYIMNYYSYHNICPITPDFLEATDSIEVNKRVHLKQIADVLQIPIEELRFLNPQYKRDIITGDIKPHKFILPINKIAVFSHNLDSIIAYNASTLIEREVVAEPAEKKATSKGTKGGTNKKFHKVKKGETLGLIARKHHTTVAKIKKLNGLRSNIIRVGQQLRVR